MRKVLFALALCTAVPVGLSGCATLAGSVQLRTDQAYLSAQIAFKTLQDVAIVKIRNGTLTGTTKARVIDLLDQGAAIDARRDNVAVGELTLIISQLTALGVKGN